MKPTDIKNPEYFHKVVDCQYACPAHTPVPEYIRLIAAERYTEAYMVNWESNVFPGVLGRTCDRPCEPACRRGRVEEEPVAICRLKRVAADNKGDVKSMMPQGPFASNGKRIALIGGGPAALTVARDLAPLGYEIDLYDDQDRGGGMMRSQIPSFRLPESVLNEEVNFILDLGVRERVLAARRELERGRTDKEQYFFRVGGGKIEVAPGPGGAYMWRYAGERAARDTVRDIVADLTHIWTIVDVGAGAERLELRCTSHAAPERIVWRRSGVGPTVAVAAGRCYYTLTENIHRGYVAESAAAYTGDDRRTIVKIADERWNLDIVRAQEGGGIFIQAEDSGHFKLWDATGHPLDHKSKVQVAVANFKEAAAWFADGRPAGSIAGWPVPAPTKESILWALPGRGWLATQSFGKTTIYQWGPHILRKVYTLGAGSILLDDWQTWESAALPATIVIFAPDRPIHTLLLMAGGRIERPRRNPYKTAAPLLAVRSGTARSEDGTAVPFKIVALPGLGAARGLLVYAYGAYGIPTNIGRPWALWGPLLARGWAIAYGMVRGGGDGGDAWAEAARRTGRLKAVEDFEAVVRAARRATGVPAARTVIAGRSAGGLIVGSLVARHGTSDLFGAAFAEVPYVDVLRTTTNPDLALTTIEYNEFGDPARRLDDFATVLEVSPVDQVAGRGAPGVFVLTRTGGNDTQVYAYEPFKWVRRLREGPVADAAGKLLGWAADEGHFYSPAADLKARSTDLAILDAWVDNPGVRKKIAAISIKTQMKKSNMTRKSRKTNMRKSRKTEGGKRRKASTRRRRATRRSRK